MKNHPRAGRTSATHSILIAICVLITLPLIIRTHAARLEEAADHDGGNLEPISET